MSVVETKETEIKELTADEFAAFIICLNEEAKQAGAPMDVFVARDNNHFDVICVDCKKVTRSCRAAKVNGEAMSTVVNENPEGHYYKH